MPRNADLPKPINKEISKSAMLEQLRTLDQRAGSRERVLGLETSFRERISGYVGRQPGRFARFSKFYTSPFVLMIYCMQKGYSYVSEIEGDILPAKLFSSMETSAGRMVQAVVLPVYGWENVESAMQSSGSVIDGRKLEDSLLRLATIKSGPRCLNDEMSKDIADDIVAHAETWANEAGVDHIDFTYGVLYGTPRQSNKKDWHILRNIVEGLGTRFILDNPRGKWNCSFRTRGIRVDVAIKIGSDWWRHVGGDLALVELLCALIRACVLPNLPQQNPEYFIADLADIVSTRIVPSDFNVSLLQRSQLEWLFFLARHYCDAITD